jgi:alpha-tubulin suppressor-like RCC1 family protein
MLSVLFVAVVSTSAVRASLKSQYYVQLARSAGDAGLAYAQACLAENDYAPQWTDAKPLTPDSDCAGDKLVDCQTSPTDVRCWVLNDGNIRTTFSVGLPILDADNRAKGVASTGTTNLMRTSDNTVWRQYNQSSRLNRVELPRKQVTAGSIHTCAIAFDGRTYCWGNNYFGQLGDGTSDEKITPSLVNASALSALSGKTVTAIAASSSLNDSYHTCAIASNGKVYCWGSDQYGQLGIDPATDSIYPVAVDTTGVLNDKTIVYITAGYDDTCAVDSEGAAYCWGSNNNGKLGDGTTVAKTVPTLVNTSASSALNGKTVTAITAGNSHTCAIASTTGFDSQAYCWGSNLTYQLGDNTTSGKVYPTAVYIGGALSGLTIRSITSGNNHTCVIASDSQAYCWGSNSNGQLGDSGASGAKSKIPVAVNTSGVLSGLTVTAIVAGNNYTCAIASDSKVYCWGANASGQLGNNSTVQSSVPVAVNTDSGLSGLYGKTAVSIAAGGIHTCAVDYIGKVYCWGNNDNGEFGNGSYNPSLVPVATFAPSAKVYYF